MKQAKVFAGMVQVRTPPRVPVPVLSESAIPVASDPDAPVPVASCVSTSTVKGKPAIWAPLQILTPNFVGRELKVSGPELPAVRASPLIRVAMTTTPDSALLYVTPDPRLDNGQKLDPAGIVHPSVPPSRPVPVPAWIDSATTVSAVTFCNVPPLSSAMISGKKGSPTVRGPKKKPGSASCVGAAAGCTTNGPRILGVSASPRLAVAVTDTPASAVE